MASLITLVVSWGLLAITLTCNLNVFFFYWGKQMMMMMVMKMMKIVLDYLFSEISRGYIYEAGPCMLSYILSIVSKQLSSLLLYQQKAYDNQKIFSVHLHLGGLRESSSCSTHWIIFVFREYNPGTQLLKVTRPSDCIRNAHAVTDSICILILNLRHCLAN